MQPTTHTLKTEPQYFCDTWALKKKFEIRQNDRNFRIGDLVILKEFNPLYNSYTGREVHGKIEYFFDKFPALKPTYCVFSFRITALKNLAL